jgi:hypothetical protein
MRKRSLILLVLAALASGTAAWAARIPVPHESMGPAQVQCCDCCHDCDCDPEECPCPYCPDCPYCCGTNR